MVRHVIVFFVWGGVSVAHARHMCACFHLASSTAAHAWVRLAVRAQELRNSTELLGPRA